MSDSFDCSTFTPGLRVLPFLFWIVATYFGFILRAAVSGSVKRTTLSAVTICFVGGLMVIGRSRILSPSYFYFLFKLDLRKHWFFLRIFINLRQRKFCVMMKPHVQKVLNLWRDSVSQVPLKMEPYRLSEQLKNFAALFAPGNFFFYVLNYPQLKFEYVHEGTREVLGIPPEELTMELLVDALLPEERESMARKESVVVDFFLNYLEKEKGLDYKSVYFVRIQDKQGCVREILHQATILSMTETMEPEYVMVIHTDVSHLKVIRNHDVSFINLQGGKSYLEIDSSTGRFDPDTGVSSDRILKDELTYREKEIIQLLGQGMSAEEISTEKKISVHTVRTHRKNSLKKSGCRNTAELVAKCLMEGVI